MLITTQNDVVKLGMREIRQSIAQFDPLSPDARYQMRFLVNEYYKIQNDRKRANNQLRAALKTIIGALEEGEEDTIIRTDNALLQYMADQNMQVESALKKAMDAYSDAHPVGKWLKNIYGIGPVIASGIIAHVDIERAPTAGHIESFAGLNPTMEWKPKTKRPWNSQLKTLFFHAGESFIKFSGKDECVYGKWYQVKRREYHERNMAGEYKEQAFHDRDHKYRDKTTVSYKATCEGRLPDAQIIARARRWTIKLFISHLHEYWYELHHGRPPALPYAIAILGHAHHIRFGEYPENYLRGISNEQTPQGLND